MGAPEREIRGLVIEVLSIQPDDILVPAFMIGVAMLAFASLYVTTPAMEAGLGFDICGDLLVARQAQANLRGFAERFVTILAFFLVFGVALNDLAGHHQLLENIRPSLDRRGQQKTNAQNKAK